MPVDFDTKPFVAAVMTAVKGLERDGAHALHDTGTAAGDRAAELVPVETGELRDSMQVTDGRDDDGYFVEVRFTAGHAAPVEFGTSTTPARHFLRQALAEAGADFSRGAV